MSGLKVLIFEYDRPFADALERAFARRGCTVRVVDDGQVGLDVALDDKPGLIILAIELPRMNGFAVCNRIKKHPDLKDIPLVIVSSDSPQETFEQHSKLRTRAEDYAHKPIDPEALIARAAAFVDIPPPRHESEILVDDEAIEEAIEEAPISLDDMPVFSDDAFDNIVLDDALSTEASHSAASLLEPMPESITGAPGRSDDFEDFTMISSKLELPANLQDIARAVEASTPPPMRRAVPTPTPTFAAPTPTRGSAPSLPRVGASSPVALPSLPTLSSAPPPARSPTPPPARSLTPSPAAPSAEFERAQRRVEELERELAAAHSATQRVVTLTEENQRLRAQGDELARVAKELEEKVRASAVPALGAAPARMSGVSTREFLELRESLNRKDKDILARDKELLELRDRLLQMEMSSADIDDRLAEREHEALTARHAGETAQAQLKAESERRAEVERSLADAEAQRTRDAAAHEQSLAALRSELEAAAAAGASKASQASEMKMKEEYAVALESARFEARSQAQQNETALRAEHERTLESARTEHTTALSALRSEHAQVVDSLRADYTTAVDAAKAEHARALETHAVEREQGLSTLASEHAGALAAAAAATAAAVAAEAVARNELAERISSLDSDLSAARAQNAAIAAELSAAHGKTDEAAREAAALRERIGAMERRQSASEALLDRARQAMEIAAGLVHAATHEQPAEGAAPTTEA